MPPSFRFQTPVSSVGAENLTVEQNITPDLPLEKMHSTSELAYQKNIQKSLFQILVFQLYKKMIQIPKINTDFGKTEENSTSLCQMFSKTQRQNKERKRI